MAIDKAYALTTRQRLIDFLGLGTVSDTTKQNVLDRIIESVTEFIENEIGRRVKETAYTNEEYDSDGSEFLLLKNFPVNSGSTFTLQRRNSALNEDDWETIDSQYYVVDYNAGIIKGMGGYKFSQKGHAQYRVTYTAGYDFDNTTTFLSDTEGGDLEYVAWKLGATVWNSRKGSLGVSAERVGDYSVTYKKGAMEDEEIQAILDKYRRIEVVAGITPQNT